MEYMENTIQRKGHFEYIYNYNIWGGDETTRNGPGSSRKQTQTVKKTLSMIFDLFPSKKIILSDIGCGDLAWMKDFVLQNEKSIEKYIGYEIASNIVEYDKKMLTSSIFEIINADCVNNVPKYSDVILCRQVLGHLYNSDIKKLVSNVVKSCSLYFITSQDFSVENNEELVIDKNHLFRARGINLLKHPFNFPEPIAYIDDFVDFFKLGIWKVSDLKLNNEPQLYTPFRQHPT